MTDPLERRQNIAPTRVNPTDFFTAVAETAHNPAIVKEFREATARDKELRDALRKKLEEAGYVFDDSKRELIDYLMLDPYVIVKNIDSKISPAELITMFFRLYHLTSSVHEKINAGRQLADLLLSQDFSDAGIATAISSLKKKKKEKENGN